MNSRCLGFLSTGAPAAVRRLNSRRPKKWSPSLSPFRAPRCNFGCPIATENDLSQGRQLPGAMAFPAALTGRDGPGVRQGFPTCVREGKKFVDVHATYDVV